MIKLTGIYRNSGYLMVAREYLRLLVVFAEMEPGEVPDEMVEDLRGFAEEAKEVVQYVERILAGTR